VRSKKCISTACLFWICATPVFAQTITSDDTVPREAMLEGLRSAIVGTPYSALVVRTKVEITSLRPRSAKQSKGADDVVGEQRHVYHARVLETFKGKAYATLRYESFAEEGESVTLDTAPTVLTLCKNSRGFYWPGTGASFPADADVISEARRVAKQRVKPETASHSQCD
jgi:hypothetical protein